MAKTRNYSILTRNRAGQFVPIFTYSSSSNSSPRVNGKLKLQSNAYTKQTRKMTSASSFGGGADATGIGEVHATSDPRLARTFAFANNEALARFKGRIRKGSASLGVTAASYRQTRDMIIDRSQRAISDLDRLLYQAERLQVDHKRRRRGYRRAGPRLKLADAYLEVVFGWKPLLQDIHASMKTCVQQAIPPETVSGRSTQGVSAADYVKVVNNGLMNSWKTGGTVSVCIGSMVQINNPNLWLANRMGLINPAVVAWDLVPWSFVVNMFANVSTILSAMTDMVGLQFGNQSTTTTWTLHGVTTSFTGYPLNHPFFGGSVNSCEHVMKSRSVGTIPSPLLVTRVPDMDMGLAAIAVSLLVQKATRLGRLLSL